MWQEARSVMSGAISVGSSSIAGLTPSVLTNLTQRLAAPEHERTRAMPLEAQRARFVVGRSMARALVAAVGDVAADDVAIGLAPTGQPIVVQPQGLFVSIAHSGDHVLAAVADRPLGVDIERVPAAPLDERVVARICSPAELYELQAMPDADRPRAFVSVWARKEAYGKALGVGMDFGWSSVTARSTGSYISGVSGTWWACNLDVDPAYVAAVVAEGEHGQVTIEVFTPGDL
jgi:4'-phosphopantetheinyl transferase